MSLLFPTECHMGWHPREMDDRDETPKFQTEYNAVIRPERESEPISLPEPPLVRPPSPPQCVRQEAVRVPMCDCDPLTDHLSTIFFGLATAFAVGALVGVLISNPALD